jgi:hypothetical protein
MFWMRYSRLLGGLFVVVTAVVGVRYGAILGVWDVIDWFVALVSLVGLFAYVHGRRVLSPHFWAIFLPVSVAWTVAYHARLGNPLMVGSPARTRVPELLIGCVFAFPLYLALFRYAYRQGHPPSGGAYSAAKQ